jgi:hypothetical protein
MSYSQGPLEELRDYLVTMQSSIETRFSYDQNLAGYVQPIIKSLSYSIRQIDENIGDASRNFRKNR